MIEQETLQLRNFLLFSLLFLSVSYFRFGTYRNWPYKIESDGKYYYQFLVSLVEDHDLDFSNNYAEPKYDWMSLEIDHYNFRGQINPITGRPINLFTIGPALLWFPFYLVAYGIVRLWNLFGPQIEPNLFGRYFQYAVMYSAVIYTILTMYLLYQLLKQYFSAPISRLSIWLILIASPLYYYTIFEPSMSHVYDLFTFSLFLFLFWKCINKRNVLICILLALSGALHVLIRTQNLITIILFSILLVFLIKNQDQKTYGKSDVINLSVYAAVLALGLLPIPIINSYLFGSPFAIPQGASFLHPYEPKISSVLFSYRNGMFSHHPLLLIGMIGYISFLIQFRRHKHISFFITLLLAFMAQTYLNSIVSDWWAGHSFGQRRLVSSLPLFAFGYGYAADKISLMLPTSYKRLSIPILILISVLSIYLTFIHVFLWSYDDPHNILVWMFYYAPPRIGTIWHGIFG